MVTGGDNFNSFLVRLKTPYMYIFVSRCIDMYVYIEVNVHRN